MTRLKGHLVRYPTSTNLYTPKRIFVGRLGLNDDLLGGVTSICRTNKIYSGHISVIGAVKNAKLGFYDQSKKAYTGCVVLKRKLEICSMSGNISLKDGEIFVHAHVVLADHSGKTFGGHLMPGAKVFAAEYFILELSGKKLHRVKDPSTGLPLWSN